MKSTHQHAVTGTRPVVASLRWGFGWTAVVAALGTAAGCVSATPVQAPAVDVTSVDVTSVGSTSEDYASCVVDLGGSPDAIEHHIDACEVVRRLAHKDR